MHYILRLKGGGKGSRVDSIPANSLKEAKEVFMSTKQIHKETFNKLYEVTIDER